MPFERHIELHKSRRRDEPMVRESCLRDARRVCPSYFSQVLQAIFCLQRRSAQFSSSSAAPSEVAALTLALAKTQQPPVARGREREARCNARRTGRVYASGTLLTPGGLYIARQRAHCPTSSGRHSRESAWPPCERRSRARGTYFLNAPEVYGAT